MPRGDHLRIHWDMLLHGGYDSVEGMLRDLYVARDLGCRPIAKILGVDRCTVRNKLREIGIDLKPHGYAGMKRRRA